MHFFVIPLFALVALFQVASGLLGIEYGNTFLWYFRDNDQTNVGCHHCLDQDSCNASISFQRVSYVHLLYFLEHIMMNSDSIEKTLQNFYPFISVEDSLMLMHGFIAPKTHYLCWCINIQGKLRSTGISWEQHID